MKSPFLRLSLLTGALAIALSAQPDRNGWPKGINPATLQLNSRAEPDLAAEGFVALFNGRNLDGWTVRGGRMHFEAKDGEIVGTNVRGEPNGFLCTDRNYTDFVFTTEFRWEVLGNSGIMFRAGTKVEENGRNRVFGYQSEMDAAERRWTGGIYGEAMEGWKYPLSRDTEHAAARAAIIDHFAWNRMTIEVRGTVIRTWINGVPVAFLENNERTSGFFGLQVHAGEEGTVHWRNIRVKEFEPGAWIDLFAGGDFAQWERVNGKPVSIGWSLRNGVAHRHGENAGDIVTKMSYRNFELVFDWKISEAGNSGVKYRAKKRLGLEYQVLDDDGHRDGSKPTHRAASLYDLVAAPDSKPMHPVGNWNTGRILVRGKHFEHWLNGFKTAEIEYGSPEWKACLKNSKFSNDDGFGEGAGRILLQDHNNPVWFRNLRIRKL